MRIKGYDGKRYFTFGDLNTVTGVLEKKVNRSIHFLRIVQGYALQKDCYDEHQDKIKRIVFDEGQKRLSITADNFEKFRGKWSKGYGKQYTISEKYLKVEGTE